jgi:hypothetical protein
MLTASRPKTAPPFTRPRLATSRDITHRNFGPLSVPRTAPLMRFSAPSAPSEPGVLFAACAPGDKSPFAARRLRACLTCSLSASRVSHPLDGFLLPGPRRFVSPDRHPWGFEPFRSTSTTGAGPKARWLSASLGSDEQARPHRSRPTAPFAPAPAWPEGLFPTPRSRGAPRGSTQGTFAPSWQPATGSPCISTASSKPPKRLRGRPRIAASQPAPRRTEERPRNVNRRSATPSRTADPTATEATTASTAPDCYPTNPRRTGKQSGSAGVRAAAPPRLSARPRATEVTVGTVETCGSRDHTMANQGLDARCGAASRYLRLSCAETALAEASFESTWDPTRRPTPDEPETTAKDGTRGGALPLLSLPRVAEASPGSAWAPTRPPSPDEPEAVVRTRTLGAARSVARLLEASRPSWASWPCRVLRRSAPPCSARV